jgi:excisionase family DNA binding protein
VLPEPVDEPVLTVERAGAFLGLSRSASYNAVHRGEIPSLKIGRRIVMPTAQLRALLGIAEATPSVDQSASPARRQRPHPWFGRAINGATHWVSLG